MYVTELYCTVAIYGVCPQLLCVGQLDGFAIRIHNQCDRTIVGWIKSGNLFRVLSAI